MTWVMSIMTAFKLFSQILSLFSEKDKKIRKKKADALKEITNGIENDDPSLVSTGFDRIRRLR